MARRLRHVGPGDFSAAKLAVNTPPQRDALLHACERVLDRAQEELAQSAHSGGLRERACERHIDEAVALGRQLGEGRSTVAVGLGIAAAVSGSIAALVEADMHKRAHPSAIAPGGQQIRHAASLVWTLVALEAEIEREVSSAPAAGSAIAAKEPAGAGQVAGLHGR